MFADMVGCEDGDQRAGGLRELKKQITRETIADAAVQLALEKRPRHVTIEEIAHVAFISPLASVSELFLL